MRKFKDLKLWTKKENLPDFRSKQLYQALTKKLVSSWDEASDLPTDLREKANREIPISDLLVTKIIFSKDGRTIKLAAKTRDDFAIEAVLLRHQGRNTVCVSTQVGCALKCKFCATGQLGCVRNLKAEEIVDQVLEFARMLKRDSKTNSEKITNVVFMGMGEPFLNYEEVMEAVQILHDPEGFGLAARKITISTSGIIPGIIKLSKEPLQINLAISLHAPNNDLRSKLMPINRKYPLEKLISAVADYMRRTNRKVFFEYILLDQINDSPEQAKELVFLLKEGFKKFSKLVQVNLIEYNPVSKIIFSSGKNFSSPKTKKVKTFHEIIRAAGIPVTIRYKFGREIKAGCGQLGSSLISRKRNDSGDFKQLEALKQITLKNLSHFIFFVIIYSYIYLL